MTRDGWSGRVVTRARKAVRARGRYQACARCGADIDLDVDAWHVDHVHPLASGGSVTSPGNWAASHARCNTAHGGQMGSRRATADRRTDRDRKSGAYRW